MSQDKSFPESHPRNISRLNRIVIISWILLTISLAVLPGIGLFTDFMSAKSWTDNTLSYIWICTLFFVLVSYFFMAKGYINLGKSAKGIRLYLVIYLTPLYYAMFLLFFFDELLPLALHSISSKQPNSLVVQYEKASKIKACSNRIRVTGTEELEGVSLCLSAREINSIPKEGKVKLLGTSSQFGFYINDVLLPRRQMRPD